jgi:hypothetical protein
LVDLAGGRSVLLFATLGQGPFMVRDPGACLAARQANLARAIPDPHDAVRLSASAILNASNDTADGRQALNVELVDDGHGVGTAIAMPPSAEAPSGVILQSAGTLVGLASPGAATVRVSGHDAREVPVHDGVFVAEHVPAGEHVTVRQFDASGRLLSLQALTVAP